MVDHPTGQPPDRPHDRLTLDEAAAILGVNREAVRSRVRRGSLSGEKIAGVWYVSLAGQVATGRPADRPPRPGPRNELVATLQAEVEDLRRRLDRSQEAEAELRRLLAGALHSLPAGSPTPAPEQTHSAPQTAVTPPPRRPWWRRLLGG